jgi:RNA polymerase sigma factor (sigma-70 family)
MKREDGGTTSPLLLKRVADWADQAAWCDFYRTYDPLLRSWSRGYGLDGATLEDLCQQIWIGLADRMRSYQYDPGRTFRGWLRRFCHSRAVDLLRKRKTESARFLDEQPDDDRLLAVDRSGGAGDEESESRRSLLLTQAEQVQQMVKTRVEPQTWQAFWRIAVESRSFRETADEMGMSYVAVFAAHKRVGRMLRTEGKRRLSGRYPEDPGAIVPDLP